MNMKVLDVLANVNLNTILNINRAKLNFSIL